MAALRYRRGLRNQNIDALIIAACSVMVESEGPTVRSTPQDIIMPKVQDISGAIMRNELIASLEQKNESESEKLLYVLPNYIGISNIKYQINSIVELMTESISVDSVVESAKSIRTCMKTAEDIIILLNTISSGLIAAGYDKSKPEGWTVISSQIKDFKANLTQIDHMGEDCVTYLEANIYDVLNTLTTVTTDDSYTQKLNTYLSDVQKAVKKNILSISAIRQAEVIALDIIQNVTDRVDFGFINRRINYLKSVLKDVDQTCMVYNKNIGDVLLCVIDMIINKKDLSEVKNYMDCINVVMKRNIQLIEMLDKCELILISIIENIIERTDFGFIIRRIKYLQEMLNAFF